jgi:selenocysteine-specific elongation factor
VREIILGTAGHIDHGKTSLIKAVTGTDTDRLKEEKKRGITIELGFASLDLPSGQHLGIVDVPGHEKFVKNMVAGATGINIVAMVIAADEGVMPQTREHMEICTLLGVQHGLVVMTKTDLVDDEWLELALEDVKDFTRNTFLENAPIIPVSAATRAGLPNFIEALDDISRQIPDEVPSNLFRLAVDRVFSMKGFGTVITGTLISGSVAVGDPVEIYPRAVTTKVRGIQVHNQSVQQASAGMRTAINFQGLEKEAVMRGDVLSSPGALQPSYMVDLSFQYLAGNKKPLKNRTRVRFHTGTSEIMGNLILLEQDDLNPGDTTMAQVRLDSPVAIVKDDRFVVRSYSPVRTTGGGRVLNPIPPKHKRFRPDVIENLDVLVDGQPREIIAAQIRSAGYHGVTFAGLKIMTNLSDRLLDSELQSLMSDKTVILTDKEQRGFIHRKYIEDLQQIALQNLKKYHSANPLKTGMPKEELKSKFPSAVDGKLFNLLLTQIVKEGHIAQEDKFVRLASHKISLAGDQADVRKKILAIYRDGGLQPPYFREVVRSLKLEPEQAKAVLLLLIDEGMIVRTKDDLFFDAAAIAELKQRLVDFLDSHGEINTPQFKEMTGASRKYVIPLLEYFDSRNVTLRVGDARKLRKG